MFIFFMEIQPATVLNWADREFGKFSSPGMEQATVQLSKKTIIPIGLGSKSLLHWKWKSVFRMKILHWLNTAAAEHLFTSMQPGRFTGCNRTDFGLRKWWRRKSVGLWKCGTLAAGKICKSGWKCCLNNNNRKLQLFRQMALRYSGLYRFRETICHWNATTSKIKTVHLMSIF